MSTLQEALGWWDPGPFQQEDIDYHSTSGAFLPIIVPDDRAPGSRDTISTITTCRNSDPSAPESRRSSVSGVSALTLPRRIDVKRCIPPLDSPELRSDGSSTGHYSDRQRFSSPTSPSFPSDVQDDGASFQRRNSLGSASLHSTRTTIIDPSQFYNTNTTTPPARTSAWTAFIDPSRYYATNTTSPAVAPSRSSTRKPAIDLNFQHKPKFSIANPVHAGVFEDQANTQVSGLDSRPTAKAKFINDQTPEQFRAFQNRTPPHDHRNRPLRDETPEQFRALQNRTPPNSHLNKPLPRPPPNSHSDPLPLLQSSMLKPGEFAAKRRARLSRPFSPMTIPTEMQFIPSPPPSASLNWDRASLPPAIIDRTESELSADVPEPKHVADPEETTDETDLPDDYHAESPTTSLEEAEIDLLAQLSSTTTQMNDHGDVDDREETPTPDLEHPGHLQLPRHSLRRSVSDVSGTLDGTGTLIIAMSQPQRPPPPPPETVSEPEPEGDDEGSDWSNTPMSSPSRARAGVRRSRSLSVLSPTDDIPIDLSDCLDTQRWTVHEADKALLLQPLTFVPPPKSPVPPMWQTKRQSLTLTARPAVIDEDQELLTTPRASISPTRSEDLFFRLSSLPLADTHDEATGDNDTPVPSLCQSERDLLLSQFTAAAQSALDDLASDRVDSPTLGGLNPFARLTGIQTAIPWKQDPAFLQESKQEQLHQRQPSLERSNTDPTLARHDRRKPSLTVKLLAPDLDNQPPLRTAPIQGHQTSAERLKEQLSLRAFAQMLRHARNTSSDSID